METILLLPATSICILCKPSLHICCCIGLEFAATSGTKSVLVAAVGLSQLFAAGAATTAVSTYSPTVSSTSSRAHKHKWRSHRASCFSAGDGPLLVQGYCDTEVRVRASFSNAQERIWLSRPRLTSAKRGIPLVFRPKWLPSRFQPPAPKSFAVLGSFMDLSRLFVPKVRLGLALLAPWAP